MKKISIYIFFLFLFLGYQFSAHAQEDGKILLKAKANQKYGPVIQSFPADNNTLKSLINKAGNFVLFGVSNGELTILGHDKSILYPSDKPVSENEKFEIFSVNKVEELMNLGTENATIIEYRGNIISLTNGNYTLASETVCPPNCP